MGVRGLMSKCLESELESADFVDLVKIAKERDGIEILVDFYSFEFFILEAFSKSYSALCSNPYLFILGAEYSSVDAYLTKLVEDLKSLNIHLVMFQDGCKGSDVQGHGQKLETYKSRHHKYIKRANSVMKVWSGQYELGKLRDKDSIPYLCYPLIGPQLVNTLKRCGCEFVAIATGEADYVIARNLIDRAKAYAVFGNDSDFFIFRNCRMIPKELFDVNCSLGLGKKQRLSYKPESLRCGVVSSAKVTNLLKLRKESDLVDLSILTGNDFTVHLIEGLKIKLGINTDSSSPYSEHLTEVSEWLRKHDFNSHPVVQKEGSNKQLREAIQKSREFYEVSIPLETNHPSSPLERILVDGVQNTNFPSTVMGVWNGIYWHGCMPEEYGLGITSCESALTELRQHWYRLVDATRPVMEYGYTPQQSLEHLWVLPADMKLPTINSIRNEDNEDTVSINFGLFEKIFTHYEPNFQPRYDRQYGVEAGFRCLLLRYLLVLNTGYLLWITVDEFESAVAMVLGNVDQDWYMRQALLPGPRCLTMLSWLQKIYEHAYHYIGKSLYLSDRFPEPKDVISGSVWTAFYAVAEPAEQILGKENVSRIQKDKRRILDENKEMFSSILQGYRLPNRPS